MLSISAGVNIIKLYLLGCDLSPMSHEFMIGMFWEEELPDLKWCTIMNRTIILFSDKNSQGGWEWGGLQCLSYELHKLFNAIT